MGTSLWKGQPPKRLNPRDNFIEHENLQAFKRGAQPENA